MTTGKAPITSKTWEVTIFEAIRPFGGFVGGHKNVVCKRYTLLLLLHAKFLQQF